MNTVVPVMLRKLAALLFLSLSFIPLLCQSEDVYQVIDKPEFSTAGENIWGIRGSDLQKKVIEEVLIDINDTGGVERRWGGELDFTTADNVGGTQWLCPAGSFIDPFTDDCYTCPTGFSHNPLKAVDEAGVCYRKYNQTSADSAGDSQFVCPGGSFLDFETGDCYSCPGDYAHNPLLPASQTGVCTITDTEFVSKTNEKWECDSGEFPNASLSSCYECDSGYGHNPLLPVGTSGVCSKWISGRTDTADSCGTGHKCRLDHGENILSDSCPPHSCKKPIRKPGTYKWYTCGSWNHNPFLSVHTKGVCWTSGYTSNKKADYVRSRSCPSGQNEGIDGYCYSCPSGYTDIAGVCTKVESTAAQYVEEPGLLCGPGEFLSGGGCYTCPTNYKHDPLLPAQIAGVCYKVEDKVAEDDGPQGFLCPAGSFFNVPDGECYQCDDGYFHNPLVPATDNGVCYKMSVELVKDTNLGIDYTDGSYSYEIGYKTDAHFNYQYGHTVEIINDPGSVDITYKPEVSLTLQKDPDSEEYWPVYTLSMKSKVENDDFSMETRWGGWSYTIDPWIDLDTQIDLTFAYPQQDEDTLEWSQVYDDTVTPLNIDSNGRSTLTDDPLFGVFASFQVGIGVSVAGFPIPLVPTFQVPLELSDKDLEDLKLKNPFSLAEAVKVGRVVAEVGFQVPKMQTPPPGTLNTIYNWDPDFDGRFEEIKNLEDGGTSISHAIGRERRDGGLDDLQLFSLNAGMQDTDILRLDLDVDGWASKAGLPPLGAKAEQPFGTAFRFLGKDRALPGAWWSVNVSALDLDVGTSMFADAEYTFKPKLRAYLNFSQPVRSVENDGTYSEARSEHFIDPGEDFRFVHPGGDIEIEPVYTLARNEFSNDTDLMITTFFAGEAGSIHLQLFPLPTSVLPKFSILNYEVELNPEPWKLGNISYDPVTGAASDDDISEFDLKGFTDVSGSTLSVREELRVQANCRNAELVLDDLGQANLVVTQIDDGSETHTTGEPLFSVSNTHFTCADLGVNSVTLTVSTESGSSAECQAEVTVVDDQVPVIEIIQPPVTEATGTSGAIVLIESNVIDNCITVGTRDPFDSLFPIGETPVSYTAEDTAGNSAEATTTVEVVDTTPPEITPPAGLVIEATAIETEVEIGEASAHDIVDGEVAVSPNTTGPFLLGVTDITWSASDSRGNEATAIQTVEIVDTTPPALSIPGHVTAEANGINSTVSIGSASATDIYEVVIVHNAPAVFPLDDTIVRWVATDANGNVSTADQIVTVVDTTPPQLAEPADITTEATGPQTPVDIGTGIGTDIFEVSVISDAPDDYPLGTTSVTWTATDANGNKTSAVQEITIIDTTAPVVIAPPDVTVVAVGLQTVVDLGAASATDAVGVVSGPSEQPLSPYYAGQTEVTWSASDSSGNIGTDQQMVVVLGKMACELKHGEVEGDDEDDKKKGSDSSLSIYSYNADPNQAVIWESLFDQQPGVSKNLDMDQEQVLTWLAGSLALSGELKLQIKNKGGKKSEYQQLTIKGESDDNKSKKSDKGKKSKKADAEAPQPPLEIVAASGGLDPELPGGAPRTVRVAGVSGVQITVNGIDYAGTLQDLEMKMETETIVREFKVTLKLDDQTPTMKETQTTSIEVSVPETSILVSMDSDFKESSKNNLVSARLKSKAKSKKQNGLTILSNASERAGSCVVNVRDQY